MLTQGQYAAALGFHTSTFTLDAVDALAAKLQPAPSAPEDWVRLEDVLKAVGQIWPLSVAHSTAVGGFLHVLRKRLCPASAELKLVPAVGLEIVETSRIVELERKLPNELMDAALKQAVAEGQNLRALECKELRERNRKLERRLAALEWRPITRDNPPRHREEVLYPLGVVRSVNEWEERQQLSYWRNCVAVRPVNMPSPQQTETA